MLTFPHLLRQSLSPLRDRLHNLPLIMRTLTDSSYMISFGRRIRKATENVRIKELYVHIPRDLCNKALTILTQFSTARAPETTPGSVPIQTRLALEAHKALYQLSLIWTLTQKQVVKLPEERTPDWNNGLR